MRLFSFASRTLENIQLGIKSKTWAVATVSESSMKGRVTKATKYMHPGDYGLLYCNPTHSFTSPFVIESKADPFRRVTDIWPEHWELPFAIRPLGDWRRQIAHNDAIERWSFLRTRIGKIGGAPAALNITGATVFVPVEITPADWNQVLMDLEFPDGKSP